MLQAVTDAISTVIGWIGTVINALVGTAAEGTVNGILAPILPLFAIGIAISAVLLGISSIYAQGKRCENGGTPYIRSIPCQA